MTFERYVGETKIKTFLAFVTFLLIGQEKSRRGPSRDRKNGTMYDRSVNVSLKLRPPQACGFLNGRTGRIVESDELVGSTLMSNKILTRGVSLLERLQKTVVLL